MKEEKGEEKKRKKKKKEVDNACQVDRQVVINARQGQAGQGKANTYASK